MSTIQTDLTRASLGVLLLAVLADGPRYGYAIQRRLASLAGVKVPWARLYPLLHAMEAQGQVRATWETSTGRRRKWYTLTDAGHQQLKHDATAWSATLARLQAIVLPAVRHSAVARQASPQRTSPARTAPKKLCIPPSSGSPSSSPMRM